MDDFVLVRDVRQVDYVVLFDGTRSKPWGKQLLTPEYQRQYLPDSVPQRRTAAQIAWDQARERARIPVTVRAQSLPFQEA